MLSSTSYLSMVTHMRPPPDAILASTPSFETDARSSCNTCIILYTSTLTGHAPHQAFTSAAGESGIRSYAATHCRKCTGLGGTCSCVTNFLEVPSGTSRPSVSTCTRTRLAPRLTTPFTKPISWSYREWTPAIDLNVRVCF